MGEYGGNKDEVIDAPNYVANRYIKVGYAERYKPCNCDDCKDGEPCADEDQKIEAAVIEPAAETANVKPKRKRRTVKK